MQRAKRCMFSMRNGVVADALRKGGCPFKIIFGVNLPQLMEIARELPHTLFLAEELWNNSTTRESMLLAPILMPEDEISFEKSLKWAHEVPCVEVADILCHKLLRKLPFALDLAERLLKEDDDMVRYTGLRLCYNILHMHPHRAMELAQIEAERCCALTHRIALSLIEDAEFILAGV